MKIEEFISGHYESGYQYKYFVPEKINHQWNWDDSQLSVLLEKASLKLGELNSLSNFIPNIELFINSHITNESVLSSRIEGTKTKFDEALFPESEISAEKKSDWREVNNYTEALNKSLYEMDDLPISTPLFKNAHKILMEGVRGEHKQPGEYRKSQNWIGGVSLADAVFIPPEHNLIGELMGDLENFLHNQRIFVPHLIKIAIAHYQIETIHPFLDGNGRIGRLMIILFLVKEKLLTKPLLYLSIFFEKNKNLYYEKLSRVRTDNDLLNWLKYFLIGIEEVSAQSIATLREIINLKENIETEINKWRRRHRPAQILLNYLFEDPVVNIKSVKSVCNLSTKTIGELVKSFEEKGFLEEVTGNNRNRIFVFKPYIDLFEK
ncbi:MAG: Fic family protein [Ignavibacteria bacterium]|nr:Fic family protein [Ignavibacteria bacterium]